MGVESLSSCWTLREGGGGGIAARFDPFSPRLPRQYAHTPSYSIDTQHTLR